MKRTSDIVFALHGLIAEAVYVSHDLLHGSLSVLSHSTGAKSRWMHWSTYAIDRMHMDHLRFVPHKIISVLA